MSKSPSLRRIQADIRELQMDPSDQYHAAPLENDMFVWHFTIRGAEGTDFEGGIYHGKILLPAEYPFKPPNIMFLTPNGRFETNTKLCLSFSAYHPEFWQPAWGIRLILEALISFLPTKGDGAIGALDWTSEERKRLAKKSHEYSCPTCGNCKDILEKWSERARKGKKSGGKSRFQKEIEQLHAMQAATEGVKNKNKSDKEDDKEQEEKKSDETPELVEDVNEQVEKDQSKEDEVENKVDDEQKVEAKIEVKETAAVIDDENTDIQSESNGTLAESEQVQAQEQSNDQNIDEIKEETHESVTEAEERPQQQTVESPLLSDPVVNTGIAIFSAIVFLLIRKLQHIVDDMRTLENMYNAKFES